MDLSDPDVKGDQVNDIKILIGLDSYYKFFEPPPVIEGVSVADSKVGKVITGPYHVAASTVMQENEINCTSVTVARLAVYELDDTEDVNSSPPVHKLWELDAIGIKPSVYSPEEVLAIDDFESSIDFKDGKYQVKLPWKSDPPELPHNYGLTVGRLRSNYGKLKQIPPIKSKKGQKSVFLIHKKLV